MHGSKQRRTLGTPQSDAIDTPSLDEEVMTPEEAARFLRIDVTGVKDVDRTLRYYRENGLLKAIQIGKELRYLRSELIRFVREKMEASPR